MMKKNAGFAILKIFAVNTIIPSAKAVNSTMLAYDVDNNLLNTTQNVSSVYNNIFCVNSFNKFLEKPYYDLKKMFSCTMFTTIAQGFQFLQLWDLL